MQSSTTPSNTGLVILVDEDTFQQHENGAVTGNVVWLVQEQAFPDDSWNDFVVVVLCWWAAAIIRLLKNSSTEEIFDFMDGPFAITCNSMNHSVDCRFVERRKSERKLSQWTGSLESVASSILDAGKATLRKCHQNEWVSPDIEKLEKEVNILRRVLRRLESISPHLK